MKKVASPNPKVRKSKAAEQDDGDDWVGKPYLIKYDTNDFGTTNGKKGKKKTAKSDEKTSKSKKEKTPKSPRIPKKTLNKKKKASTTEKSNDNTKVQSRTLTL